MTKLKGTGKVLNKIEKQSGEYKNYTYEIEITGKPNKAGISASTMIRFSAYKDFGGVVGDRVAFEAELKPYVKKDGSGSSYFFSVINLAVISESNEQAEEEKKPSVDNTIFEGPALDDDITKMFQ